MASKCQVAINDQVFFAARGEVLLDAALMNGVDLPYDCRSGHCGTCRVRVVDGSVIGGDCGEPGAVRACQSRIISDLRLETEDLPDVTTTVGEVRTLIDRAPDVVEVGIAAAEPMLYLPGQYLKVQFRGFPTRCYSPTASVAKFSQNGLLHLHVRRVPDGRVSNALGSTIRKGHRVKINGPFGTAFLRPGESKRLVLVASGTGFAPIWSIAIAAIRENPRRRMVVVVGARTVESLYMIDALCMLARYPNVTIIPAADTPQTVSPIVRVGSVADHMPELTADDVVHTCGGPGLVGAISKIAAAAGVPCYCDPFVPQGGSEENLLSRAFDWLNSKARRDLVVPEPRAKREQVVADARGKREAVAPDHRSRRGGAPIGAPSRPRPPRVASPPMAPASRRSAVSERAL